MADDADWLAWMLGSTAGPIARHTPCQESTAVPPEQVDITFALRQLHKYLPEFMARIIPGDIRPHEWASLAKYFGALSAKCRHEGEQRVVLEQDDVRLDPDEG